MTCPKCHGEPKTKPCGACGKLPPVIEIHNEECPILFHTVEIDGSSEDNPPYIGQYKNTLLVYKENGAKYLFSSDGVPSALSGDTDFNTLINRPKYDGTAMTGETNIPKVPTKVSDLPNDAGYAKDADLATVAKTGKYSDLTGTPVIDVSLDKTSTNAVTNKAIATAIEEITTEIDRPVVYDLEMDSDANSVTFTEDKIDVVTGETTQETDTIPTASKTTAGTISAAEYLSIKDSQDRLDALENGSVAISGLSATPTQAQLTTAWLTATGRDSLINRASIYDIDNTKVWTYYSNITTWEEVTAGTISVNPFTNSVAGTILGSAIDGNVSANLDGTGTVSGWSTLVSTVSGKADSSSLASVATSGNYSDLNGKPTIDSTLSTSSTNAVENQAIGNEFEKVAYVGSTSTTPSSVEFVGTDNIEDGAVTADKTDLSTFAWADNTSGYVIGSSDANGNKVKVWHTTFTTPAVNTELLIPLPNDCASVITYSGFVQGTGNSSNYKAPLNYSNSGAAVYSGLKTVNSALNVFMQVTNTAWAGTAGELNVIYISNS